MSPGPSTMSGVLQQLHDYEDHNPGTRTIHLLQLVDQIRDASAVYPRRSTVKTRKNRRCFHSAMML
ncbi:hypothetical protein BDZ89DRAFT_619836 [Hymenopellis radicata]|nr:hypothetical protein BDZ89DRAFT_619836 [Hymenopellis radicata]